MAEQDLSPQQYAFVLEELRELLKQLDYEISSDEQEKIDIFKRMNELTNRANFIDSRLVKLYSRRDDLDEVLTETTKGLRKIEATTKSLLALTKKQLQMLKRTYHSV